jgi:hypothetical protein
MLEQMLRVEIMSREISHAKRSQWRTMIEKASRHAWNSTTEDEEELYLHADG